MTINLTAEQSSEERHATVKNLKILWAVHYMLSVSDNENDIAAAVNIKVKNLKHWIHTPEWHEALEFWNANSTAYFKVPSENDVQAVKLQRQRNDLKSAKRLWHDMIQNGEDLFPPEIPSFEKNRRHIEPIGLEADTAAPRSENFIVKRLLRVIPFWIHDLILCLFITAP